MIQWRNFNIDPDWYLGKIGVAETGRNAWYKTIDGTDARRISEIKIWLL